MARCSHVIPNLVHDIGDYSSNNNPVHDDNDHSGNNTVFIDDYTFATTTDANKSGRLAEQYLRELVLEFITEPPSY